MSRELAGYTSPHHEGAWSNTKNYTPLSVVTNSGSSYIAKKAVPAGTALNNSVYWGLLASVGSDPNISITKTGTSGLVDTYTWTDSTSGNTGTFTVTNGQDGDVTADVIATPYDNTVAYKIGNLLTYLGKQYYCIADAPAGTLPTNTTYFEEKSVADIIEMIKQGAIVTGHSQVADNLTPYSEDSGTTQENPFISQGTGTDNNSVIVTTGNIARQLEKQGNTLPVMQLIRPTWLPATQTVNGVTLTNNGDGSLTLNGTATELAVFGFGLGHSITAGHKYMILGGNGSNYGLNAYDPDMWHESSGQTAPKCLTAYTSGTPTSGWRIVVLSGVTVNNAKIIPCLFDITSWNSSIITDLTSHPEHFSWYYNGSLAYNAGSLQNCNGRYLECGQWRNQFNPNGEFVGAFVDTTGQYNVNINTKSLWVRCIPNRTYSIRKTKGARLNVGSATNIITTDGDKLNTWGTSTTENSILFTTGQNDWWMMIWFYNTNVDTGLTVKEVAESADVDLYYTPEQGGEGYNQHYDYVAPIRIDTGNEVLRSAGSAKDVKLPSGLITRNVLWLDIGNIPDESLSNVANHIFRNKLSELNIKPNTDNSSLYINVACPYFTQKTYAELSASDNMCFAISGDENLGDRIVFIDQSCSTINEFKTKWNGKYIAVEIETPTTEQGTPYSEYADINDYSYMAWFDTDGNLVSIPQGCKLFYPVDYKGFLDDGVMYTNGDFTALAKNEDITDSALNARGYYKLQDLLTTFGANGMVGGTLRNALCAMKNLSFNNTGCIDLGTLTFSVLGGTTRTTFVAIWSGASSSVPNRACSKYSVTGQVDYMTMADKTIQVRTDAIYICDTDYTNATDFNNAMKGVLLAYEKA